MQKFKQCLILRHFFFY